MPNVVRRIPLIKRLVARSQPSRRPWDAQFLAWIAEAKRQGLDPNDVADSKWGEVRPLIEKYYLTRISPTSVVLELGCGTGRITRHVVDKCSRYIIVDFSATVVDWIRKYLRSNGRQNFEAIVIDNCRLAPIGSESIDVVIADGVFHHVDLEDFHRFLHAFMRVLKPGGHVAVNFVSIMAPEGYAHFRKHADSNDQRDPFRWHHPESVRVLAQGLDFREIDLTQERVKAGDFVWYLTCRKTASAISPPPA